MPRHRWDPVAARPRGLVWPVRVGTPEGPTRSQAADHRYWRTTSRGWYVPTYVDGTVPEQRILEQSVRLPTGGAVTGWAALRLLGAAFFDGLAPDGVTPISVPLAVGADGRIRADHRVRLHYCVLPAAEVVLRHGIRTVVATRALADLARHELDLREVVVAIDMGAAAELVSCEQLAAYSRGLRSGEQARLRTAVDLASEHSRSPNESRLRLVAELDAGVPRLLVNSTVLDRAGRSLGEVDLLDVEAGLVMEYDGADHRTPSQHTRDVAKEAALRSVGLEVARVTGADLRDPATVVARLQQARARARFEAPDRRAWKVRSRADDLHRRLEERAERRRAHADLTAASYVAQVGGGVSPAERRDERTSGGA